MGVTAALRSDGSRFPECDESRESDRGLSTGRDQPKQTRDGSGTWKTCSKKLFHVGDVVNGRKTSLVVLDVIGDEPTGIQERTFKLHCDLTRCFLRFPSTHTQSPFLSFDRGSFNDNTPSNCSSGRVLLYSSAPAVGHGNSDAHPRHSQTHPSSHCPKVV